MEPVLEIKGLKTQFQSKGGLLTAVDGIDLSLGRGETLGLVGESGCGKERHGALHSSTAAQARRPHCFRPNPF